MDYKTVFPIEKNTIANAAKYLTLITILAVLYYGIGKLGLAVALPIPPSNITAVWFPSAIAWFVLMKHGAKVLPGLWIADMLLNVPERSHYSTDLSRSATLSFRAAIRFNTPCFPVCGGQPFALDRMGQP